MLLTEILTFIASIAMCLTSGVVLARRPDQDRLDLHGPTNIPSYDDCFWKKCGIGEWLKVTNPSTGQPVEKNIFYPGSGRRSKWSWFHRPANERSIYTQRASKRCNHRACNF